MQMLRHFLYFSSNLLGPFSTRQKFVLFEDKLAEGMLQRQRKLSFRVENSAYWKTGTITFDAPFSSLIGLQAKKNSVSCCEIYLVQNGLNLGKIRLCRSLGIWQQKYQREFGNATRQKQSNLNFTSHLVPLMSLLSLKINGS